MVIKNIDGLLTLIKNSYETLAPAQKSVARYIVESYQNIPFLSVTAMAREIGVSDTTIIKYCMQLGFSGYGDFKRQVTNAVQVNADWHSRFEAHLDSVGTKSAYSTYETEVKNLQGTFSNPINQQNYEALLDALDRAETIYIMGFRSSSVLARFMSLSLGQIGYRTQLLAPEACDLYELSMRMTPKDLLISFSISRYSSDAVLIAQNADMSGVPHVAFADTMLSPVAAKADLTMVCEVDSCNNVPSLTGAVGLISLVLTGCGQRHREKAQEHMKRVEGFLSENHLLYTPDGQC